MHPGCSPSECLFRRFRRLPHELDMVPHHSALRAGSGHPSVGSQTPVFYFRRKYSCSHIRPTPKLIHLIAQSSFGSAMFNISRPPFHSLKAVSVLFREDVRHTGTDSSNADPPAHLSPPARSLTAQAQPPGTGALHRHPAHRVPAHRHRSGCSFPAGAPALSNRWQIDLLGFLSNLPSSYHRTVPERTWRARPSKNPWKIIPL